MILKLNRLLWLWVMQIMLIFPVVLIAQGISHTVKKGDTLFSLSKQYGTTVDELMKLNKLQGTSLSIGQKLIVKQDPKPAQPVGEPPITEPLPPEPIIDKPVDRPLVPAPVPSSQAVTNLVTPATLPGETATIPKVLSEDYYYTVKAKDNLYRIAKSHEVILADMLLWNGFANDNAPIHPGDRIIIKNPNGMEGSPSIETSAAVNVNPDPTEVAAQDTVVIERVYVVQKKDTLYKIASTNGMTVEALKKLNNLTTNDLKVGQRIYLAGTPRQLGSINPEDMLTEEDVKKRDKIRDDLFMPVEGRVISEYGLRNGRPHKGIDLGAKQGTPVYAVLDGTVVYSGAQGAYGNVVVIEHPDFVMTVYAHNESNLVAVNDVVKKGQQIATVGSTGNAVGSHLHFEYRLKGKAINPRKVLPIN